MSDGGTRETQPQSSARALAGIQVLDFTHYYAGPYCTKLMAGLGAEVIKIEPHLRGDGLRRTGPFYENEEGLERSIPFLWLNTGKKSVGLDLESKHGRAVVERLVKQVDVIVENFSPGVMTRLGLDYESLRPINPGIVMTSISNFGSTGPHRHYQADEINMYAACGAMNMTGSPDREPLNAGPSTTSYMAALHAYIGTLLALYKRNETGEGQHVDVSIQESGIESIEMTMANYLMEKRSAKRAAHPMVPWDLYACKDGHAAVLCAPFRHWPAGAEIFESRELMQEKYHHILGRIPEREKVESLVKPWIESHTKREIFEAGQRKKLAFAYLPELKEVFESPQHRSRGYFVKLDHPEVGEHEYCGAPYRLSKTPWKDSRAPLLGEHTESVLRSLADFDEHDLKEIEGRGNHIMTGGILDGVRIVDLTHSWAAPHATRILADSGAEVIRVEYSRRMCALRGAQLDDKKYNQHPMWHQVNRGKKSVTLDFHQAEHRELLRELVAQSDMVVENARSGALEGWGLGYEELRRLKPDIILLSMPAYGSTGPHASFAGYGGSVEVQSGIQNFTAYADDSWPRRIKELDVTNGVAGACAAMTALLHRQMTGEGQWVDMSFMEATTHTLIGEHLLQFAMNGENDYPRGNRHPRHAPQGCYPCAGDDCWVTICIRSDKEWRRFCAVTGNDALGADSRFLTSADRRENHDALDPLISEWTCQHSREKVVELLQGNRLAATSVMHVRDLAEDDHLKARNYFVASSDGASGPYLGPPVRLSETPMEIRRRGPELGEHNEHVVHGLLGKRSECVPSFEDDEVKTAYDLEGRDSDDA